MWAHRARLVALGVVALVAAGDTAARAGDDLVRFDFGLRLSNRFNLKRNFLNTEGSLTTSPDTRTLSYESPLNLRLDKHEAGHSVLVGLGADLDLGSWFSLHLTADSGELKFPALVSYRPEPVCTDLYSDPRCGATSNRRSLAEEAEKTGFVRELYLQASLGGGGWLELKAGKLLASTGDGYIMDNYALGASLTADLDRGGMLPLRVELDGLLPNGDFSVEGKHSPYLYLDVAWIPGLFEELGLFVAWFHDGDDNLGDMLGYWLLDTMGLQGALLTDVTSSGDLFWIGLRGSCIFERASLTGTAIVEFGRFDLGIEGVNPLTRQPFSRQGRPSSLGGMLDLALHVDLADFVTAGVFFLYLSGEKQTSLREATLGGRFRNFLSVYPYITRTNIFFSGGMNENYSARSFATSGINARGVLAPGLSAGFDLGHDVTIRLVSALLFSDGIQGTSDSHWYGWENDLNFQWNIEKHVRLLFEADWMWTGGFFDFPKPLESQPLERTPTKEPDSWKILVGLDLFY